MGPVQRRVLFWVLVLMTVLGNGLVLNAIFLFTGNHIIPNLRVIVELVCISLLVSPWSVKLPSGASWRPGMPLMMISIFLERPAFVVVVPLLAVVFITALSHAAWWKYFETIAHVAIGLYAGALTYSSLVSILGTHSLSRTIALIPGLVVHLMVNRGISAIIVAHRERRPLYIQMKMTFRELHWGYINTYMLVILASMVETRYLPIGMLLIIVLQIGIFLSVSHYSRAETIQKSVWMDGLTYVENRASWERFCQQQNAELRDGQLGVIDVNNFKDINDRYGHLVGDEMLRNMASILQSVLPRGTRLFRIGGDEFVVFLARHTIVDFATIVHKGLLQQNALLPQTYGQVSVSVGQAVYPNDGMTLTELFRVADERMYKEKRSARYTESGMDFGIPASILSLILAVESRDSYTSGHNLRVAYYAWQLAAHMGIEDCMLKSIFRAGLVHDVGKIGIPDSILNKQGRLTLEEFRIVQQHPVTGFEMCSKLNFEKDELDVIYYHHERWDGTGYPSGLSGFDIPLLARITAVADVYDALTSVRSYREAWSHEDVMRHLVDGSGYQFDPQCVDHWIELNDKYIQKQQFLEWFKETTFKDKVSELSVV